MQQGHVNSQQKNIFTICDLNIIKQYYLSNKHYCEQVNVHDQGGKDVFLLSEVYWCVLYGNKV